MLSVFGRENQNFQGMKSELSANHDACRTVVPCSAGIVLMGRLGEVGQLPADVSRVCFERRWGAGQLLEATIIDVRSTSAEPLLLT